MYFKRFVANIVFLLMMYSCFGQKRDSIIFVMISDRIEHLSNGGIELSQMEHFFFDVDADKIYYQFKLTGRESLHDSAFIFLEIKKKTLQQYRLKPLYTKKIELSSLNSFLYTDSILLSDAVLASGNFEILINLMNDSNKVVHLKKAGFQLLRSGNTKIRDEYYEEQMNKDDQVVDLEKSFVGKYNMEAIKRNIASLKPISEGIETKVIRDLSDIEDLKFLKQFFYNFWYNRNTQNPESEWKAYAELLNKVAKEYGTATQPGYETDRGRIYIQYGMPDKMEKVPSEKDALPYEIWFYSKVNDKSFVCFLFYQPGIVGSQMFLLHSTEEKEMINPYWKDQLLFDPNDNDNKLKHRVFEYFK